MLYFTGSPKADIVLVSSDGHNFKARLKNLESCCEFWDDAEAIASLDKEPRVDGLPSLKVGCKADGLDAALALIHNDMKLMKGPRRVGCGALLRAYRLLHLWQADGVIDRLRGLLPVASKDEGYAIWELASEFQDEALLRATVEHALDKVDISEAGCFKVLNPMACQILVCAKYERQQDALRFIVRLIQLQNRFKPDDFDAICQDPQQRQSYRDLVQRIDAFAATSASKGLSLFALGDFTSWWFCAESSFVGPAKFKADMSAWCHDLTKHLLSVLEVTNESRAIL